MFEKPPLPQAKRRFPCYQRNWQFLDCTPSTTQIELSHLQQDRRHIYNSTTKLNCNRQQMFIRSVMHDSFTSCMIATSAEQTCTHQCKPEGRRPPDTPRYATGSCSNRNFRFHPASSLISHIVSAVWQAGRRSQADLDWHWLRITPERQNVRPRQCLDNAVGGA